jgi:predicted NBD/HSP70 family sugar kinase
LLEFNPSAGTLLIAELGASGLSVGISDLSGNLSQVQSFNTEISLGPDQVLNQVESAFDAIIAKFKIKNIWGIGIGLPGPVEFAAGIPMSPPIMPGWDRYPVRKRLADKYKAPVWVDNDVNLMALGEHVTFPEKKSDELIYIKIGSGIGAGILTHGRLHRGAQGCAGDIGHIAISEKTDVICRCGNVGCLESVRGHPISHGSCVRTRLLHGRLLWQLEV